MANHNSVKSTEAHCPRIYLVKWRLVKIPKPFLFSEINKESEQASDEDFQLRNVYVAEVISHKGIRVKKSK